MRRKIIPSYVITHNVTEPHFHTGQSVKIQNIKVHETFTWKPK